MTSAPVIVWFRLDLRLSDNPALSAAASTGRPLILLYILDDETPGRWRIGGAQRWWLHHSLVALDRQLRKLGCALLLKRGAASAILPALASETGAEIVFWNRCYEPYAVARDTALKKQLGIEVQTFASALLHEPWMVKTKSGDPFKVFTPFWRATQTLPVRPPLPAPRKLTPCVERLAGDRFDDWRLTPQSPDWASGFEPAWTPSEAGAQQVLARFIDSRLKAYPVARDSLDAPGTSRLSPHLHFGEITPAQIAAAICDRPGAEAFLREIAWRDFSYNLLFHWPAIPEGNWRAGFDRFPWRTDPKQLEAWRRGRTGYPVVDAAMRQLWTTGWMHNRARMIAASFLIKHLLIDWREGEAWFWDTLVDADLANNAASWQWVAGSGADAAPYFRIFNPVSQGERFDAAGDYVRRWLPELAQLDASVIHKPWTASAVDLAKAGVVLGETYPRPIVDHAAARARALAAFATLSATEH